MDWSQSVVPLPAQPLSNSLPKSFYRASNLGVTHESELIGFPDPVIIENLQPAPPQPIQPVQLPIEPIPNG